MSRSRSGAAAASKPAVLDVLTCLRTRRCVRAYRDEPVPRPIIEAIVDCARLSPSARNVQPWAFVVVTETASLERVAALTTFGKHIAQASACIAVFCRDTKFFVEDGSAASMAILLAAWAQGVASCWVAGDKMPYAEAVRALLRVHEGYHLVSLVPLGYPAERPIAAKRPLSEVLHWEAFDAART